MSHRQRGPLGFVMPKKHARKRTLKRLLERRLRASQIKEMYPEGLY